MSTATLHPPAARGSTSPATAGGLARQPLSVAIAAFKREFAVVGLVSLVVNVLMLAPTLYMLQVYDRVMISQSQLTLLALTLIVMFFLGVMAFADVIRSRLIVASSGGPLRAA